MGTHYFLLWRRTPATSLWFPPSQIDAPLGFKGGVHPLEKKLVSYYVRVTYQMLWLRSRT